MSDMDYPSDINRWATNKGIKRPCRTCGKEFDPFLLDEEYGDCLDCYSKRKMQEEEKQKRKELWDSIVWPN